MSNSNNGEPVEHKRNAALKQTEMLFGLDRNKDGSAVGGILNNIFGQPWSKKVEEHGIEDIKNAITAARAAQGDKPTPPAPPQQQQRPQGGNGTRPTERREGETDNDYARRVFMADLKGRDYLMVAGRVWLFRRAHPIESGWQIATEPIGTGDDWVVFIARIITPEGIVVATGHARADAAGTKSLGSRFWEKAESAAIGRALAMAGFGTAETDDDFLADSPLGQGGDA